MKRQNIIGLLVLLFSMWTACKTAHTSMLVTDSYDEQKKQTTLTLIPTGNIILPEKWKIASYNQVSKQHFLTNNDSTTIAVTKNPQDKYSFYNKNYTDSDFVAHFVKWDADYWTKQGLNVQVLDDQTDKGYIIWQAKNEDKNINTIFLFGSKNGLAYNFSGSSKKWSEAKIKEFIIHLFNTN